MYHVHTYAPCNTRTYDHVTWRVRTSCMIFMNAVRVVYQKVTLFSADSQRLRATARIYIHTYTWVKVAWLLGLVEGGKSRESRGMFYTRLIAVVPPHETWLLGGSCAFTNITRTALKMFTRNVKEFETNNLSWSLWCSIDLRSCCVIGEYERNDDRIDEMQRGYLDQFLLVSIVSDWNYPAKYYRDVSYCCCRINCFASLLLQNIVQYCSPVHATLV